MKDIGLLILNATRFMIVGSVLLFACSVLAAGLAVPQSGIALGEVQSGEAIEKMVVIGNDTERTISVSRVKACCGGEAELVPMSVPAKGEAKLTLKMKAQIPGEISKAVTLYCDDPHQPIVEIPVTGRVVETAEVKMMAGGTVAAIIEAQRLPLEDRTRRHLRAPRGPYPGRVSGYRFSFTNDEPCLRR